MKTKNLILKILYLVSIITAIVLTIITAETMIINYQTMTPNVFYENLFLISIIFALYLFLYNKKGIIIKIIANAIIYLVICATLYDAFRLEIYSIIAILLVIVTVVLAIIKLVYIIGEINK